MSQLAAVEQGLYYPTDQRVLRLFVEKNVSMRGSSAIEIFDPCVGEGLALFEFAKAVKEHMSSYVTIRTTGIEIEEQRAQEAKKIIGAVHHGSFEDFSFVNEPHIIFANVPYDAIKGKRVELDWISKIAQIMSEHTRLVLVLPSRFFEGGENHNDMRLCLYQNKLMPIGKTSGYNMQENLLGALKFPEPEYQMFKQHIYVVEKKTWGCELMKSIKVDGVVGESRNKYILGPEEFNTNHRYSGYTSDKKYFQAIREESKTYDSIFTDESKIVELFGKPKPQIPITPLMPMRDEILAAAIAGGLFGGIRVGNSVIRGGSTTIVEETERIADDEVTKEIIKTSKLIAHISELSMETGDIVTYNSDAPEFGQKIEEIAFRVKSLMNEMSPSLYRAENDYERLHNNFANVRAPRIKRDGSDDLIITQKQAASTILRGWESTKSVFLMGEMGVGKTISSIAAVVGQVQNRGNDMKQKIVLLIPSKNDLVEKWKMEISNACRDIPHTVVDVETITDVQKAFAIKGITFIVVKESMVKRTSGVKNIHLKKKCFNCGSRDGLVNAVGEIPEKDNETLFCMHCGVKYETYVRNGIGKGNPFNGLEKHMDKYYPPKHDKSWEKGEYEKACALILSHYTTHDKFEKGNAYSSLAEYINDHYAKGYVLVIDEAHQMKSGDSARGYASGSLIRGASRVLMMTGTFYNGYASSMYFNLYRCSGSFREGNTYDGVMDFVRLYGLEEEIVKLNRDNVARSWSGYNVKKTVKTKEIPGIHPAMIGLMLPYTVFMKLSDMNTILPPQFEHTLFVDIPNEANSKVREYLRKVKDKAVTLSRDSFTKHEGTSLLGQYTWAKSGAFDVYPIGDTIESENESFGLEPVNPKSITPKEDALLRIACECKRKGFPLLIYYGQTDRRPIQNRFADQFAKLGMKLSYMPSTVKSRVEFIEKSLADGSDAVICNANLVREGIDLLMFRAIVWYGVTPDAILVNQANARIHRIGKQYPTDVYYLGYNETYQAAQWLNTSKKVQAMQAMHGDVRAGLAALLGERSMINEIQDSIISYERYDSDLKVTDFPEASVFARDAEGEFNKKFKIAEKIMASEITLEEWKRIHLPTEDKKIKKVKTQFPTVPQLFMF